LPARFGTEADVMSRVLQISTGTIVVAALIAAPVAFALYQQGQMRNFRVVRDGVLYRSGQMTIPGLKRVFHDHGIKTVVCLRDGKTDLDRAEEAFCNSEEVTFVRIPPTGWGDFGTGVPVEAGVRKFKEVLTDPRNYPVLVHCFAGIHRTGAYTAIYRMEFEHWSNEQAMAEMRACGYDTLDEEMDILSYLEQYHPEWQKQEHKPEASARETHKPEAPAKDKAQPRKHLRRPTSSGLTLVTARHGGGQTRPATLKKRASRGRPSVRPQGHKKQSPPARRGATLPGGVVAPRGPGAA
jgi:protein tyrosine/serine phosphatase